jgi:archaellum biogenesis ATPase FlaH
MLHDWEKASGEKTILAEGRGVKVTNARLIVYDKTISMNKTYFMNDITSVKIIRQSTNKILAMIFFLAGVFVVYQHGLIMLLLTASIFFILAGFAYISDFLYQVKLTTSQGEVIALTTDDRSWAEKVVRSIEEAIQIKIRVE